jgi:hypothetical protein
MKKLKSPMPTPTPTPLPMGVIYTDVVRTPEPIQIPEQYDTYIKTIEDPFYEERKAYNEFINWAKQ